MQQLTLNEQSIIEVINSKQENYELVFSYNSNRQGWFVDVISESFKIYGLRVTCSTNMLKQWEDKLGFGIAIKSENDLEPFFQEDFLSERARIYLIEPDDLNIQKKVFEGLSNEQL